MRNDAENEFLSVILDVIGKTEKEVNLDSEFNAFDYDSFTKINMIFAIEAYTDCAEFDIDEFLLCDTYRDLINLTMKLKKNKLK